MLAATHSVLTMMLTLAHHRAVASISLVGFLTQVRQLGAAVNGGVIVLRKM